MSETLKASTGSSFPRVIIPPFFDEFLSEHSDIEDIVISPTSVLDWKLTWDDSDWSLPSIDLSLIHI